MQGALLTQQNKTLVGTPVEKRELLEKMLHAFNDGYKNVDREHGIYNAYLLAENFFTEKKKINDRIVKDLAMLCKRLAFRLGRGDRKIADKTACKTAMQFLVRHNLQGSLLRESTERKPIEVFDVKVPEDEIGENSRGECD